MCAALVGVGIEAAGREIEHPRADAAVDQLRDRLQARRQLRVRVMHRRGVTARRLRDAGHRVLRDRVARRDEFLVAVRGGRDGVHVVVDRRDRARINVADGPIDEAAERAAEGDIRRLHADQCARCRHAERGRDEGGVIREMVERVAEPAERADILVVRRHPDLGAPEVREVRRRILDALDHRQIARVPDAVQAAEIRMEGERIGDRQHGGGRLADRRAQLGIERVLIGDDGVQAVVAAAELEDDERARRRVGRDAVARRHEVRRRRGRGARARGVAPEKRDARRR